jgi:hypothetical protein
MQSKQSVQIIKHYIWSNVSCISLAQLLHNSNNYFLRSTIEYLGLTCRKTNLMVDHKKKKIIIIIRVVQKLYESCAKKTLLLYLIVIVQ